MRDRLNIHRRKDIRMKTRLAAALAGLAGLVAAGLVGLMAPAASATETQPDPVCEANWQMRGATGAYPAVVFGDAPDGSLVTKTTAKLVKPAEGVQPGVEFAAFDLEIQAHAENQILVGVDYATSGGATTAAGAIRLFGYAAQDANTLTDAPDWKAVAESESGHLVLTIPAGKKLGTLGMVFDASNSSQGSVTFSDLKIDNRPVWFTGCPEPEPTATATPEPTQTATPGPGGTETPNVTPTAPAPPRSEPTLPVTGSTPLMVALAGLCVLGAGGLLYWLSRRRQVTFRS